MTPDVNVLVAASRDDHPHHLVARRWLEDALDEAASGASLILLPMVVASFLRLTTHPRVFVMPTPIADAIAFVETVLGARGVRMPAIGAEWPRLKSLCLVGKLRANALPDAWIAAAIQELGEHLATFDTDFRKLLKRSEMTLLAA